MCLNSKSQLAGIGNRFQKSIEVAKAKLQEGESWSSGVAGNSSRTSWGREGSLHSAFTWT